MGAGILKIGASIATPLALAGFIIAVLYLLYWRVLQQKFSKVIAEDTFKLFDRLLKYLFILALVALILGVSAFVSVKLWAKPDEVSTEDGRLEQDARQHLIQGYYQQALNESNELIRRKPTYAEGYKLNGHAHYMLHEYSSALQSFQHALNIDPKSQSAMFCKGAALAEIGDFEEAEAVFRQLKDDDPSNLSVRYNLAGVELRLGKYTEAREGYGFIYNLGSEFTPEAAVGLGLSDILSVAPGLRTHASSLKAVSLFRGAVCSKPALRGVFVGAMVDQSQENYEGYRALLSKIDGVSEYRRFIRDLRVGKFC